MLLSIGKGGGCFAEYDAIELALGVFYKGILWTNTTGVMMRVGWFKTNNFSMYDVIIEQSLC